jgi:hypothetical protein
MFGVDDPLIYLPYLLAIICVGFAAWYGIKNWSDDNDKDELK